MSLSGLMDIGVKALNAQQLALQIAGHNIANASTPGYSKQVAVMETTDPASLGNVGQRGTGLKVTSILRIADVFTTSQINTQMQKFGKATAQFSILQSAELIFNETSEFGLGNSLVDFFNAWGSLSASSASQSERDALIQKGNSLAAAFSQSAQYLARVQVDAEKKFTSTANEINPLTLQIATLNTQIREAEVGGGSANDLRDRREQFIKELSEKIEITTLNMNDGTVSVFLPRGILLVESTISRTVSTAVSSSQMIVNVTDASGNLINITSLITEGELGGLITGRDTQVQSYIDRLDELALGVIVEVNKLHYAGYGLDGTTSNLFFQQVSLLTGASSSNTGTATINSGAIGAPNLLTADDYEIRFTGAAAFDVVNTTTGVNVVTGAAYVSGANITDIPGITVVITDGAGTPANGDVFTVGLNKARNASNIALDSAVTGSTDKIAAAQTDPTAAGGGVGDNRVALLIAALNNTDTMSVGTSTFAEFYSTLVSSVGTDVSQAEMDEEFFDFSLQQLINLRESISGVSIDEETTDLIKFQNGYAAASRLISVASELMEILVHLGE